MIGPMRTAHEARNRVEPTDHLCINISTSYYPKKKEDKSGMLKLCMCTHWDIVGAQVVKRKKNQAHSFLSRNQGKGISFVQPQDRKGAVRVGQGRISHC